MSRTYILVSQVDGCALDGVCLLLVLFLPHSDRVVHETEVDLGLSCQPAFVNRMPAVCECKQTKNLRKMTQVPLKRTLN